MASEWYTLASQKLFLSRILLTQLEQNTDRVTSEALLQGAIELAIRAGELTLVQIARYYQHKTSQPRSVAELSDLIGEDAMEAEQLTQIARQGNSWLNHLSNLDQSQCNPPAKKKTVSDDNIIAVTADSGPDRSASALLVTVTDMKAYLDTLAERHEEW